MSAARITPQQTRIDEQLAWLREKSKKTTASGKNQPSSAVTMAANEPASEEEGYPRLPEIRGIPNSILRSALFGIDCRERPHLRRAKIASLEGLQIIQSGEILVQSDLDVWEECVQMARVHGIGQEIKFSAYEFLHRIGRSRGGSDVKWLEEVLIRLVSTTIEVRDGPRFYAGHLITKGAGLGDGSRTYIIQIDPAILSLFGPGGWSAIEIQQRRALKNQPTALWLHGFYSSHAQPHPMKVATLHKISNSKCKSLKDFRTSLKNALDRVCKVTGWSWDLLDSDLVSVSKTPTSSQARHIMKKRKSGK